MSDLFSSSRVELMLSGFREDGLRNIIEDTFKAVHAQTRSPKSLIFLEQPKYTIDNENAYLTATVQAGSLIIWISISHSMNSLGEAYCFVNIENKDFEERSTTITYSRELAEFLMNYIKSFHTAASKDCAPDTRFRGGHYTYIDSNLHRDQ